jgi:hypothetical protein
MQVVQAPLDTSRNSQLGARCCSQMHKVLRCPYSWRQLCEGR